MSKMSKRTARFVSAVISVMLAAVLAVSPAMAVFAAEGSYPGQGKTGAATESSTKAEVAEQSKGGVAAGRLSNKTTLGDLISGKDAEKADEKDPLEDTVVVLMDDSSLGTEKKVRKTLQAGDGAVEDINVEEVWNFDAAEDKNKASMLSLSEAGGKGADDDAVEYEPAEDAVVALVSSDSMSADRLARRLNGRRDVKLAEKNYRVHSLSVTNDKYVDHQWSMQDDEIAPHIEYIWNEKGVKGSDRIVAVLDTGIDYTHPDLKDNLWVNTHRKIKGKYGYDFINGTPDPLDDNGHGTHCAGVIGAVGNNGIGTSGVNQNIKIMALKTLDFEGSSWLSHEIAAYNYINMALDLGEPVVAVSNSWSGGEDSGILVKLIDIVGEKGAVTVCAAGNDGSDIDDYGVYPASLDSPYIISVAATGRDGKLASFSNYGESVDVAAPGTEILSTVNSEIYNPSIYGDDQDSISAEYNNFEEGDTWGIPDKYYLNGEECTGSGGTYTGEDGQTITVEEVDSGFTGSGKSLQITFKKMKTDDLACFEIPYDVADPGNGMPSLSMMMTGSTKVQMSMFGGPIFGVISAPANTALDLDTIGEMYLSTATYVQGDFNDWEHLTCEDTSSEGEDTHRKFIVLMYASANGDYSVRLDDMGMSHQDIEPEAFGKYEFMSGTSMATPFVSGTVALKAAEKLKDAPATEDGEDGPGYDVTGVISEICAMSKDEPEVNVASGGSLDFKKVPTVLPPRIGTVTVNSSEDGILIHGSGLDPEQEGFKVEIGPGEEEMKEAEVVFGDGRNLIIKDNGWINNVEDIRITGAGGKKTLKKNVYLVKGKNEYKKEKEISLSLSEEAYTTDGKKIYDVWSTSGEIKSHKISSKDVEEDTVADVDAEKIFKMKKEDNVQYGMLFGKDLVYLNKKLYNVIEYGAIDAIETESDDFFIFGKSKAAGDEEEDEDGSSDIDGPYSIYSGEYRLISVDTTTGSDNSTTVKNLGELPEELTDLTDFAMAAYNGKLYFIGGYLGYGDDAEFTSKVFVYDPKTATWSEGVPLPEPRACGKALQYDNMLIYTLGTNEETEKDDDAKYPDNLIFDGKAWKTCEVPQRLEPLDLGPNLNVGLTKDGLIYTGVPFADFGDTVLYDVKANAFVDSGYNFIQEIFDESLKAVAVGSKLYGETSEDTYSIPIASGLKTVSYSKKGKGKVTGTGSFLPGNDVKVTVKASRKYYIKSFKVGSKKISLKKNTTKKSYTIKAITADKKVTVVFARKKAAKKSKKK